MAKPRIAILASGTGTTAESFIRSVASNEINAEVVLLVCNNKKAEVFDRVNKLNRKFQLNIKTAYIGRSTHPPKTDEKVENGHQTEAEKQAILDQLEKLEVDIVLLLGYMKLIGKDIVKKYGWHEDYKSVYQASMINTHPGLLPETKGLYGIHVQQHVLNNNLKAGHCLFVVDSEYDDGPVIFAHEVEVLPNDTPEKLFDRVKASEKRHLAEDVREFIINRSEYLKNG